MDGKRQKDEKNPESGLLFAYAGMQDFRAEGNIRRKQKRKPDSQQHTGGISVSSCPERGRALVFETERRAAEVRADTLSRLCTAGMAG